MFISNYSFRRFEVYSLGFSSEDASINIEVVESAHVSMQRMRASLQEWPYFLNL